MQIRLLAPELVWLCLKDVVMKKTGEFITEQKYYRKCCTHLSYRLAVSVLPFALSLAVSVPVPLTMAVALPAAFSVIVFMPITAARLVTPALFSGAAMVPFPGTFSSGIEKHHWTVYKGLKVSNTKSSRANSQQEDIQIHSVQCHIEYKMKMNILPRGRTVAF